MASYYERNREKVLARSKQYYQEHREEKCAYGRRYYHEHREELRQNNIKVRIENNSMPVVGNDIKKGTDQGENKSLREMRRFADCILSAILLRISGQNLASRERAVGRL